MPFTADRIRTEVADILGERPEDIPLDADLTDYGLDSVRLMALLVEWNREMDTPIEFADFAEQPVIEEWVTFLAQQA